MGRAPCCDKVGLKKGPWNAEEDQILISFIQKHGHSNWRALPKQAGLLRCGKSCRLRWINYLKPDIKRGNFTKEEEETIIKLHEMMGNRWSAIAARLPGRTDNEIKNVWHTHLKKRLPKYQTTKKPQNKSAILKHCEENNVMIATNNSTCANNALETSGGTSDHVPTSSQQSYSSDGFSSITEVSSMEVPHNNVIVANNDQIFDSQDSSLDYVSMIDETYWSSQELSIEDYDMSSILENTIDNNQLHFSILEDNSSGAYNNFSTIYNENSQVNYGENMDFWFDVFVKASGATGLPEF